jgi:LPS export ABC transporter permease LptF/LPS export ABC transporter permease LptG
VKTLDRYMIREILVPLGLSLLVLTFVLEIPPILREAEALISKGVAWSVVGRVLLLLLPQALGITIPMAVLLGILIGFGRLSADREFVAMQACGISVFRLVRPVAVIALVAMAADAYVMIVALPNANQTFREITFNVVASRAESNVKPRVFFDDFPNRTLYVRDVVPGGWRDVFLADTTRPDETTVYLAKEGRLIVDREKRSVVLELKNGTQHTTRTSKPEEYEGGDFASVLLTLDADAVFPRFVPAKGIPEMTIAELRQNMVEAATRGEAGYSQRFMIQQKFSIPAASLVLALIGLALGVSNRKDGRLASFVLGFGVIFAYYVCLWTARALSLSGGFPTELGPWIPNLLFGAAGVALLVWRSRSADQPIRVTLPAVWRRAAAALQPSNGRSLEGQPKARRVVVVVRVPHVNLPRPNLLDMYVSSQYLRTFLLGVVALLGIFYIATFMDLADKLFRGSVSTATLLRYFYFQTPQYIYYVIPMSALVATLVTIGVMTKNSELIVIRACGVSLYRTAAPLLLFALVASAVLFGLQEQVLAYSNREADQLIRVIRGLPPRSFGALDRRWTIGQAGDMYHYDFFDSRGNEFSQLAIYRFNPSVWGIGSVTRASRVKLVREVDPDAGPVLRWKATNGWSREFSQRVQNNVVRKTVAYTPFVERNLPLEPPGYFKSDEPDAELMTYGQLQSYIAQLRTGGYNVIPYMVSLQRKVAFPFVTVVLTLLAVPFAVTTGRRGALYGIGVGIVLAILYWLTLSVFAAVGAGGLLSPLLAAWAPNIFFAAAAVYMLLTVRT